MVATKQHSYPTTELDAVHRFLLSKAAKRNRKLVMVQKELAAELDMEKTRFHRIVAQMVDEGRLRVVSPNRRGDTVIVAEL
jgi:DNA-binding MarR family transcriptional regulator